MRGVETTLESILSLTFQPSGSDEYLLSVAQTARLVFTAATQVRFQPGPGAARLPLTLAHISRLYLHCPMKQKCHKKYLEKQNFYKTLFFNKRVLVDTPMNEMFYSEMQFRFSPSGFTDCSYSGYIFFSKGQV